MHPQEPDRFWMVWNPDGHAPRFRHYSENDARTEAKRLASSNPGQQFFVLCAIGGYVQPRPEPNEIVFADMPF